MHDDVRAVYSGRDGPSRHAAWETLFQSYSAAFPDLAEQYARRMRGELPSGWKDQLPTFPPTQVGEK